jgi:hypothetical protein
MTTNLPIDGQLIHPLNHALARYGRVVEGQTATTHGCLQINRHEMSEASMNSVGNACLSVGVQNGEHGDVVK